MIQTRQQRGKGNWVKAGDTRTDIRECYCVGFKAVDVFEEWRASIIRGHPCGLQRQSSANNGARQFTSMKNRCSARMKWHMHLQRETDTGPNSRENKPNGPGRWQNVCLIYFPECSLARHKILLNVKTLILSCTTIRIRRKHWWLDNLVEVIWIFSNFTWAQTQGAFQLTWNWLISQGNALWGSATILWDNSSEEKYYGCKEDWKRWSTVSSNPRRNGHVNQEPQKLSEFWIFYLISCFDFILKITIVSSNTDIISRKTEETRVQHTAHYMPLRHIIQQFIAMVQMSRDNI